MSEELNYDEMDFSELSSQYNKIVNKVNKSVQSVATDFEVLDYLHTEMRRRVDNSQQNIFDYIGFKTQAEKDNVIAQMVAKIKMLENTLLEAISELNYRGINCDSLNQYDKDYGQRAGKGVI